MGIIVILIIGAMAGLLISPCVEGPRAFAVGMLIYAAYFTGRKEEIIFAQTGRYYEKTPR